MSPGSDSDLRTLVRATLLPGFSGTRAPEWILTELGDGLAGVCLFGSNIVSVEQLRKLASSIQDARPGAVIALDEEGGDVTRLHYSTGSPHPGNAVLGRLDSQIGTHLCAGTIGAALRLAGCTMNLAPVLDINSNPDNPVIGVRSFGSDPDLVAGHGAAWIRGLQSAGASACAKHFPGHGDTGQDSHLSLPVLDAPLELLRARELVPFRAAIAAGTDAIMTSHILVPALDPVNPATFSSAVLQDLLRGELGFAGAVVTDALDMYGASGESGIPRAAVRALAAGCDLLCLGSDTTEDAYNTVVDRVLEAVAAGELDEERLSNAARRVSRLASREARPEPAPESAVGRRGAPAEVTGRKADTVSAAFSLSAAACAWLSRTGTPIKILQLDSVANMAVGQVPWGPVSAAGEPLPGVELEVVAPDLDPEGIPPGTRVALAGRGLHLLPQSRELVRKLRGRQLDLLVVEMGWPSGDEELADMCTFGASQLVSRTLLNLLTGSSGGAE